MRRLLHEPEERARIAASGLERVRARHTCAHRAEELERILGRLGVPVAPERLQP
jgi:spore maturation protein CgeB